MRNHPLRSLCLIASLLLLAGCPSTPVKKEEEGPPPAQNMLGSTDELQLVTELSLNLAKDYGANRILVIYEVDNTLLAWDPESGCPSGEMQPTQADGAEQVRRLQDAGLKVMVMTTRSPECKTQILGELQRNGFDFQATAWPPAEGWAEPFQPEGAARPVLYRDGVYFISGQNKGKMLKALMEKSGQDRPVLFLVVDQRQSRLNEVMKVFSWTGTKVHAWRYTREDPAEVVAES